jgi:atypical dual specificity phosphatase
MNFTWIDDGLLSASACPTGLFDLQELAKKGVRAIVTLTEKSLSEQTNLSEEQIKALALDMLHEPIIDYHAPDETLVRRVVQYIDVMQQDGAVHVHCLAGQERTGTILHVYYMLKGQTIEEANAHIALVRPQSAFERLKKPQQVFLRELEKKLKKKI